MGCLCIAGLPLALSSPVSIYTPGWREALWELSVLPKNTTQCPRPGLELIPIRSRDECIHLEATTPPTLFVWTVYVIFFCFIYGRSSPPSSPRAAPYLHTHPGAAQPVSITPASAKKYRNPATIPETFSTTVDSRGSHSDLSSRSSSQSSLSLASTMSPHQSGGMNVGRLEPLIQAPSDGDDTNSELFSPTT